MKSYFLHWTNIVVTTILALIFLSFTHGCMYYYKVQTVKPVTSLEIKMYDSLYKYLILHQGDTAWHLTNLGFTNEQISGELSVLPGDHMKYKTTKPKGGNRYKKPSKYAQKFNSKKDESNVLSEVHLYLKDTLVPNFASGDSIQIAYTAIQKGAVYKKDKGRTYASWLVPGIGGPILAFGILLQFKGSIKYY